MWDLVSTWSMIVIFGVSFALEPSCPVCSKFEYEEKLLERVIRNELALKDTLDKITETHAKVADTLTRVSQAVKGLEDTKQDLRVNVEAFLNSGTKNASANVADMKSSVQSLMGQTSKELEIMREGSVVPLIMFHARLQHSGTTFTYATNESVKFNTVLVNEGGVYDPVTGRFTASVAGVYMFTVQYCPKSGQFAYFEIVHEDKPVQKARHGDPSYYVLRYHASFCKNVNRRQCLGKVHLFDECDLPE